MNRALLNFRGINNPFPVLVRKARRSHKDVHEESPSSPDIAVIGSLTRKGLEETL
jgi:hypothetical protein